MPYKESIRPPTKNDMSSKKYAERPSPSFSAADFPGAVMRGNKQDDWLFSSNQNSKGVYAWKKLEMILEENDGKIRTDTGVYEPQASQHGATTHT
jgi:hypothetical protein